MEDAKFKTRISLKDTLRDMPVSGTLVIKNRTAKVATLRSTATELKKEGYDFFISDKHRIDDAVILRLK